MALEVTLLGKQALTTPGAGPYSVWHYQVALDATVKDGDVGLGFSSRIDIQDPSLHPDVAEVQGTRLVRHDSALQFVVVPVAAAAAKKLDVHLVAPSAGDAFTPLTLAAIEPVVDEPKLLAFSVGGTSTANTTQVLNGPAPTLTASVAGPSAAPARVLPYASELFGVYQPLVGWRSQLAHERVSDAVASRFRRAASLVRKAAEMDVERPIVKVRDQAFTDRTGTRVGRELATVLSEKFRDGIDDDEWKGVLASNGDSLLRSATDSVLRVLQHDDSNGEQGTVRTRMATRTGNGNGNGHAVEDLISHETAAATLLHHLGDQAPAVAAHLFVKSVSSWERALNAAEWFTQPITARDAFLSPIGLLHMFREYFFELGTFLGPPVGHVWLSPGGTVELVEVNTRRTLVEKTQEQSTESTQTSEFSDTNQDELSDAVKIENATDTRLGATASANGGVTGVWQASGTSTFNLDMSRRQAQEQTHRRMRQQSSKLSSQVRQNFKTTFRTVTETTDTSSRRYVLQNTTDRLVSYELSRKMRKVAVQVQDLGQQLCWQLYLDKPGDVLGTGEFVHATASSLDPGVKQPDYKPYPANIEKTYQLSVPFILYQGADDEAEDTYETESGNRDHGIFEPDVGTNDIVQFKFDYTLPEPPPGYQLAGISQIDFHGAQVKFTISDPDLAPNPNSAANTFSLRLTHANFAGKTALPFDVMVAYTATDEAKKQIDAENSGLKTAYDDEVAHKREELFYDTLRKRLKLVGKVMARPQEDLREEERDVVYRALISKLYGNESGWTNEDYHVASELIRYLFDVDSMLYFVAPDWWRPRAQPLVAKDSYGELQPTIVAEPAVSDVVLPLPFGPTVTIPGHRARYLITEETAPAPMGASLGWLIQLDGDEHRNAFLNSPWVKAVLPIRPGRERDAIAWLQRPEVAGTDGLSEPYPYDAAQDPPEYKGRTIEEVLLLIADKIAAENNDSLTPVPTDPKAVNPQLALPTETVFAHGFDPLEGGIAFGSTPFKVFSEWLEILPTDQVVATEYSLEGLTG